METRFSPRSKLIAFWVLAGLTVVGLAHFFSVLAPFMWAIITAYIFTPLITLVSRRAHLPRPLVASVVYLAIMAALIVVIITLVPVVQQQGRELINQLPQTTEAGVDYFYEHFPNVPAQLGLDRVTLQRGINDVIGQITSRVPVTAITVAQRLFHFVLEFFVYLIATFFFFLQGDRFIAGMRRAVPLRYQRETERVFGEINSTMGAYLRGQVILIIIMSTVTYIALWIYDMPYALALAVATGCLELIPILGPWSAGAIAVTVAALSPTPPFGWSNATLAIVVAITYLTLRQLEDILVIPTLIGRIVHLHPVLVIFVLLIGTSIGGILGLLLAVPTAAVVRILLRYVYGKLVADAERRIVSVSEQADIERLSEELPNLTNVHIVVLTRPGALRWEDLPLVQGLAGVAGRHGVNLSAITSDPVAGSLFTAVGVETSVVGTAEAAQRAAVAAKPAKENAEEELATLPAPASVR